MHGEQLVVHLRRDSVIIREGELDADQHGLGTAHQQEEERVHDIEDAEPLVIDRDHPAMQPLEQHAAVGIRCAERAFHGHRLIRHPFTSQCNVVRYATT